MLRHPGSIAPAASAGATTPAPPTTASCAATTTVQGAGKRGFVTVYGPDNKTFLLDSQRCQFYTVCTVPMLAPAWKENEGGEAVLLFVYIA